MALRTFDLGLERSINLARLAWVSGDTAADETGLAGNRDYMDLRGIGWDAVAEAIVLERDLLARLAQESDPGAAHAKYLDEIYGDEDNPLSIGLDLGVVSAVFALSAAGCVPCSSCNGGAIRDGAHAEAYPLVAFYLRKDRAALFVTCAQAANVGLYQTPNGEVIVYARDVIDLVAFAAALRDCSYRHLVTPA